MEEAAGDGGRSDLPAGETKQEQQEALMTNQTMKKFQ